MINRRLPDDGTFFPEGSVSEAENVKVLGKRREMTMKSGTFSVKLEFAYDADTKKINRMEVLEIDGKPRDEELYAYVQSTEDTYIGTIGTTIIITKKPGEEADPCIWIWNSILQRWFRRCWVPQS